MARRREYSIMFYDVEEQFGKVVSLPGVIITRVFCSRDGWASVLALTKDGGEFRAAGAIYKPETSEDSKYTFHGEWFNDPKWGLQFRVIRTESENLRPTKEGIIAFLSSGFIKGLGAQKAARVYAAFGDKTYDVIENDHLALAQVKGISEKTCEMIRKAYLENFEFRRLREFLPPEVSDLKVRVIYEMYKGKSVNVLQNDPYKIIVDLSGVGFKTADKLAVALGIAMDDPRRVSAAIVFCLREMAEGGHCYTYANTLHLKVVDLLGVDTSVEVIADELKKLVEKRVVYIDGSDGAIYYHSLYKAESESAKIIRRMLESNSKVLRVKEDHIKKAITQMEMRTGYVIEPTQIQAVNNVFQNTFSIITGGPGTGKSTIIRLIIESFRIAGGDYKRIALAAPTGKAARRMTEVTGMQASTIHQLISLGTFGDDYDRGGSDEAPARDKQIEQDLIIVDEASMMDIRLAYQFLARISDKARVILVGDIDQLPPIGPGNFFRDLVKSYKVPSVKLKLCFRQSGFIASNARHINEGQGVHAFNFDETFAFLPTNKEQIQETVISKYCEMAEKYGVEHCIILAPMKTRSTSATNALNAILQDRLNPKREGCYIEHNDRSFRLMDRVMQTVNRWRDDVANGDVGFVSEVEAESITVNFDSGVSLTYTKNDALSQLTLAYAMTVHKSQGSEYKGCVVVCNKEHYIMLQRNLLYTAITRAKEEVALIGDARSIGTAAATVQSITRNTKLRELVDKI